MPQYEAYGTNFSCWELLFAPVNDDICPGGGEPSDDFKEKCGCNDAKGSGAAATTTIAFALRALMPALLLASVAFSFV